jgi:hypothetical protein
MAHYHMSKAKVEAAPVCVSWVRTPESIYANTYRDTSRGLPQNGAKTGADPRCKVYNVDPEPLRCRNENVDGNASNGTTANYELNSGEHDFTLSALTEAQRGDTQSDIGEIHVVADHHVADYNANDIQVADIQVRDNQLFLTAYTGFIRDWQYRSTNVRVIRPGCRSRGYGVRKLRPCARAFTATSVRPLSGGGAQVPIRVPIATEPTPPPLRKNAPATAEEEPVLLASASATPDHQALGENDRAAPSGGGSGTDGERGSSGAGGNGSVPNIQSVGEMLDRIP